MPISTKGSSVRTCWKFAKETRFRPKNILLRRELRRRAGLGWGVSGGGDFLTQFGGPGFVGFRRWKSRMTVS